MPLQDASSSPAITGARATARLLDAWTYCLPEPPILAGDDPDWWDFFVRGLRERRGD